MKGKTPDRAPAQKRQIQAYGIGSSKSGTSSLARIFELNFRSKHEAEHEEYINMSCALRDKAIEESALREFLRDRDKRLQLDMDSSQLNRFFADLLADEFPDSKYILTIRDCYSWANSLFNHHLAYGVNREWKKLSSGTSARKEYKPEEEILEAHAFSPLHRVLRGWTKHNNAVLKSIPESRLLIIRTHELSASLERIAEFIGVDVKLLDQSKSHSFKNEQQYDIAKKIDPVFFAEQAKLCCGDLMERFFPEIHCPKDGFDLYS